MEDNKINLLFLNEIILLLSPQRDTKNLESKSLKTLKRIRKRCQVTLTLLKDPY